MSGVSDQDVIRRGSQSFYLASKLFKKEERTATWKLYRWCRYCDDALDGQVLGHRIGQVDTKGAFRVLLQETEAALSNQGFREETRGLAEVLEQYRVPKHYVREMLRGMWMDEVAHKFQTFQELLDYCYCVASTVGLMMCSVLGLSEEEGLAAAQDLGVAMQLTNIVRDLRADLEVNRVYLPEDWLERFHLPNQGSAPLLSQCLREQPQVFTPLVKAMVERADAYYSSGLAGLRFLSLSAAWAVAAAALIYRAIGYKRLRRDPLYTEVRVYVSQFEKCIWVAVALVRFVLPLACKRLFKPWRAVPVAKVCLSPFASSLNPQSGLNAERSL
jgi:15-cis-phytoene synthase